RFEDDARGGGDRLCARRARRRRCRQSRAEGRDRGRTARRGRAVRSLAAPRHRQCRDDRTGGPVPPAAWRARVARRRGTRRPAVPRTAQACGGVVLTIVHASDIHFGPPYVPAAGEAFLRSVEELDPDVIVLSGDFTQRAKREQYADARAFINRLPPKPVIVTPGNHDIPLYRVFERIFAPYR